MANPKSFTITLNNNRTEKEGINYLLSLNEGFLEADKNSRKAIFEILNLDQKFARAFDLVLLKNRRNVDLSEGSIKAYANELVLIELKTTKKFLPNNPTGFFFGATENEFDFGRRLKEQFRFCFVCLHPQSISYSLQTMEELERRIKNKRIQYQINL